MPQRMHWLGHSCLLFETDAGHVLVDPFLTGNPKAAQDAATVPADFILVSHGHSDHVGDTVAIAQRTGATVIANFEIANWFGKHGVKKVHGMQHGGSYTFPFGRVKFTLAFHGSALPDGSYGGNPCGFLLTFADGKRVYDAADTGLFGDMQLIGDEGIDLAILPIGDNFTMGPEDALRAVQLLRPKRVLPIHYDTFPLIAQDAQAFARTVQQATGVPVSVLQPGESLEV